MIARNHLPLGWGGHQSLVLWRKCKLLIVTRVVLVHALFDISHWHQQLSRPWINSMVVILHYTTMSSLAITVLGRRLSDLCNACRGPSCNWLQTGIGYVWHCLRCGLCHALWWLVYHPRIGAAHILIAACQVGIMICICSSATKNDVTGISGIRLESKNRASQLNEGMLIIEVRSQLPPS